MDADANDAEIESENEDSDAGAAAVTEDERAALFARSPSARRLILHYALLRARAKDVPRCTQLFKLAGSALSECVGEHLDFVYSLVELLSGAPSDAEEGESDTQNFGGGGGNASFGGKSQGAERKFEVGWLDVPPRYDLFFILNLFLLVWHGTGNCRLT
ncbi:hypothetical protein T492DRAFT_101287 [Pavlovales sp. CCMP2436]|nr:hypothetical protein T492DRAFT_101287 [Pavlovales sp. CCMP2436]